MPTGGSLGARSDFRTPPSDGPWSLVSGPWWGYFCFQLSKFLLFPMFSMRRRETGCQKVPESARKCQKVPESTSWLPWSLPRTRQKPGKKVPKSLMPRFDSPDFRCDVPSLISVFNAPNFSRRLVWIRIDPFIGGGPASVFTIGSRKPHQGCLSAGLTKTLCGAK